MKWSEAVDTDGEGNPITRYTATASYTGTSTSRYATGYTVNANYTGEVSKANCSVVTYTVIFGSEKAEEESQVPDSAGNDTDQAGNADPGAADTLDTTKDPVDLSSLKRPLIIGAAALALCAGGVFAFKKIKERR